MNTISFLRRLETHQIHLTAGKKKVVPFKVSWQCCNKDFNQQTQTPTVAFQICSSRWLILRIDSQKNHFRFHCSLQLADVQNICAIPVLNNAIGGKKSPRKERPPYRAPRALECTSVDPPVVSPVGPLVVPAVTSSAEQRSPRSRVNHHPSDPIALACSIKEIPASSEMKIVFLTDPFSNLFGYVWVAPFGS